MSIVTTKVVIKRRITSGLQVSPDSCMEVSRIVAVGDGQSRAWRENQGHGYTQRSSGSRGNRRDDKRKEIAIHKSLWEPFSLGFNTTKRVQLHEIRPGSFGQSSVDKHGILNFNIICLRDTYFEFNVEFLNGLYIENNNYSSFKDTVKFDLSSQRA